MKPEITVIVPIYNVERYIRKCLDSLLAQTFANFEIWAVDDGSPDNSTEIVLEYAAKDQRIKSILKENGGYGSVLQDSIDRLESKYFLICDPDDWLAPDALEKLYNFAEEKQLDLAVADKYNVYEEDGEEEYVKSIPSWMQSIKADTIYTAPEDVQKFSLFEVTPHAKLYKTSIAKGIVFPQKVSYTDFVLYMLALSKTKRIAYDQEALAYYLKNRPGNTATDVRPSVIKDYLAGFDAILKQLPQEQADRNKVLYYRLFIQLRYICKQYAKVSKDPFKDEYIKLIYQGAASLQPYRQEIYQVTMENTTKSSRIFQHGLLTPLTSHCFVKKIIKKFM
ncbi:glycosyltransferase family 2 protein [Lactobacillus delbrueckii]|uniref:glycosyltransferase family 2 protein n=1 Tax=Lactobacillus delbrueckii TaxID=1584 RepID=UPI001C701820|nr:glycosyltransferase family 2 protein [Lactobacillus delbrueckii]MBW9308569.1 glycosyltransferase family 2 protein [Lactobacillus delbrueckii]